MVKIEMVQIITFLLLISCSVWCNDEIIGVGKWSVLNIVKCPEHSKYSINIEVSRKKMNRSHDGFSGNLKLENPIDKNYGIKIDICKYVDGGCKPFQVVRDDCLCSFLKKYAEDNVEKVLRLAKVDPPDCPIPKGEYHIENFFFDYCELPEKGLYGKFEATAMITTKDNYQEKVIGCLVVTLKFEKDDRDGKK